MANKIKLHIVGLSSGQTSGSYTLILGEDNGRRKLPIIIGSFEAQAIAIEIEKIVPFRPMTHDLFVNFCRSFHVEILEILIYNMVDGVFHAKLICEYEGEIREIDARTSDSIALAVRFKCPIYTYENIMTEAGMIFNEDLTEDDMFNEYQTKETKLSGNELSKLSIEELEYQLKEALNIEDYQKAALVRDELNKRKK
ncbi:MAG: bifunctional nuclease family protein [Bacteroidia bacterium]|nr:bifunctional nuclease family protein [Bacteroidia bacterium]